MNKIFYILSIFFIISFHAYSQVERSIVVSWNPPPAEEVDIIDGYNVYQIFIQPEVKPLKYDVNIVSPLPSQYTVSYKKLNFELIPKDAFEFVIEQAFPGMQTVVRAYSADWDKEFPDSDILTFRPLPTKPTDHKTKKVIKTSYFNYDHWTNKSMIKLAMTNYSKFKFAN